MGTLHLIASGSEPGPAVDGQLRNGGLPDAEALDAYSRTVSDVAEQLGPSVGVNTAVAGVGLGLAVPINATTRRIISELMREGRVRRAYIGVTGGSRPLPPRQAAAIGRRSGVEIVEVVEGSPAADAGLRAGDLIIEVDGEAVGGVGDLQRLMSGDRIGQSLTLRIDHRGRLSEIEIVPGELED